MSGKLIYEIWKPTEPKHLSSPVRMLLLCLQVPFVWLEFHGGTLRSLDIYSRRDLWEILEYYPLVSDSQTSFTFFLYQLHVSASCRIQRLCSPVIARGVWAWVCFWCQCALKDEHAAACDFPFFLPNVSFRLRFFLENSCNCPNDLAWPTLLHHANHHTNYPTIPSS